MKIRRDMVLPDFQLEQGRGAKSGGNEGSIWKARRVGHLEGQRGGREEGREEE